jgi:hypothetical protein
MHWNKGTKLPLSESGALVLSAPAGEFFDGRSGAETPLENHC